MNKGFLLFLFLLLIGCIRAEAQDKLVISPSFPQRGERLTIQYYPGKPGTSIADTASEVALIFTYSNLYEIAGKISMQKTGDHWETSFVLPRYATYATFYLQSGNQRELADSGRHFAITVYKDKKRIENSYLYEGYSLPAQMGKAPGLAEKQAALYRQELNFYPTNYEAKLRLLKHKMATAPVSDAISYRKEAQSIIAAKFYEDPGNMGLMNKTTMGYLIIGENSRVDSIREVIRKKYPDTEAGYELRIDKISEEKDSIKMIIDLLGMLKKAPPKPEYVNDAHRILFEYYASHKQPEKVLYHLHKMVKDTSPYAPLVLKKQAAILLDAGILPDEALSRAEQALAMADSFPASLIRYFPETGYIPAYVSPEARTATTAIAKGNMLSIIALLQMKQGRLAIASETMAAALRSSADAETLQHAGEFYERIAVPEKAFDAFKQIVYSVPEDTLALQRMKANFFAWKNNSTAWEKEVAAVEAYWQKELLIKLKQEMILQASPEFLGGLVDLKGASVAKDMLKDKIVIIDFWATWCVPCIQEMPYLQKVYDKYKNDPGVVFMVINSGSDNTLADAQGWWGNKRFSFPVYYNNDRTIGDKFKFNLIPATYILDDKGNIRFKSIGFEGAVIERKFDVAIQLLKEFKSQN